MIWWEPAKQGYIIRICKHRHLQGSNGSKGNFEILSPLMASLGQGVLLLMLYNLKERPTHRARVGLGLLPSTQLDWLARSALVLLLGS